jgi:hypothetical protein
LFWFIQWCTAYIRRHCFCSPSLLVSVHLVRISVYIYILYLLFKKKTNPTNKLNLLYIIKNKNKYKKTWGTRPRSNCGSLKIYNCLIKNLLRKTLRKKLNEEKKNAMLEIRFTKFIFQKVSSIFSKDITNISNDVIGLRVHSRHVKFLHC